VLRGLSVLVGGLRIKGKGKGVCCALFRACWLWGVCGFRRMRTDLLFRTWDDRGFVAGLFLMHDCSYYKVMFCRNI
jgi:hypothetical protein